MLTETIHDGDSGGELVSEPLEDHQNESKEPKRSTRQSKRSVSPSAYRKPCDLCHAPKDVLVRCRIDETQDWHFVCTSKCWKEVSGDVIDGPDHADYKYGGMWKNKHAGVSAKKPKQKSRSAPVQWTHLPTKFTKNDRVKYDGVVWICRRSHTSGETTKPGQGYTFWKEEVNLGNNTRQEPAR